MILISAGQHDYVALTPLQWNSSVASAVFSAAMQQHYVPPVARHLVMHYFLCVKCALHKKFVYNYARVNAILYYPISKLCWHNCMDTTGFLVLFALEIGRYKLIYFRPVICSRHLRIPA